MQPMGDCDGRALDLAADIEGKSRPMTYFVTSWYRLSQAKRRGLPSTTDSNPLSPCGDKTSIEGIRSAAIISNLDCLFFSCFAFYICDLHSYQFFRNPKGHRLTI